MLTQVPRPTSAFIASLVEAALPFSSLPLTDAARAKVLGEVADFVQQQLNLLSAPLRILFALGMIGFRGFAWLRQQDSFADLPLPQRARLLESWAYGSLAPARTLLKPVRSLALFAFYESPEVQAALQVPVLPATADSPAPRC